jgi:hypothetical protein
MSKSMTRRALVASTAAMPAAAALGLPAVAQAAAEPDPIFAAMEKYLASHRAFMARCEYEDDLAEAGEEIPAALGDHRTAEMVTVVNASTAAREELADTSPTTLAGLLTYLTFVHEQSAEGEISLFEGGEETLSFTDSLARSARVLARVS